jgi:hypothetical protein
MSLIVSRNNLLILPGGSPFSLAGTAPEVLPKLATNTLARARQTQAVITHEGGLVTSPAGFYVVLAEKALDESGAAYEAGTTLYMPPTSPVQVAAKSGVSKTTGDIEVIHGRPHPRSAKAMASGIAMTSAAFIVGWATMG